ncbi:spore protease YyaC [Paenibacillus sp. MBLB4367]|uniref:spore protease YyaC n=1 Tax=Paenibacillus sp. MBLB4367 TaxID=3384767 RepID=UPI003907E938
MTREQVVRLSGKKMVREHGLLPFFRLMAEEGVEAPKLWFVCIGTDRSSGDSLGPLTGTLLTEAGYANVIGTLAEPCDADRLPKLLQRVPAGAVVLAVDACVGRPEAVGYYRLAREPIEPGRSMGRPLPSVGDWSIAAIVCENKGNPAFVLQRTPLNRVLMMARHIVKAVQEAFSQDDRESRGQ